MKTHHQRQMSRFMLRTMSVSAVASVLLAAVIVVLDQAVKALALWYLSPGVPQHVIDGLVALRLGFNPGLAFGLLAGLGEGGRWVVSVLSIAALGVLVRVAYQVTRTSGPPARIAVGLVFGGALGNLIDRARHGAVVDFIDVRWRGYRWPAFNTADSAITVGVILLALLLMGHDADRDTSR